MKKLQIWNAVTSYDKWKIPCLSSCDQFQSKLRHTKKKKYCIKLPSGYIYKMYIKHKFMWEFLLGLGFYPQDLIMHT